MGCKQSTTKDGGKPKEEANDKADEPPERNTTDIVTDLLCSFWQYLEASVDEDLRPVEWSSFLCTLFDDLIEEHDQTAPQARKIVDDAVARCIAKHKSAINVTPREGIADDRMSALLRAWYAVNPEAPTVDREGAAAILQLAKVGGEATKDQSSFADLVQCMYAKAEGAHLRHIFDRFAEGAKVMSPEQLFRFYQSMEPDALTFDDVQKKVRQRMGGALTYLRFAAFFSSPATNSILDPRRSKKIWQDMGEPLTRYSIATQVVRSRKALTDALLDGEIRALVIDITRGASGPAVGDISLKEFLIEVRHSGFVSNRLPIILVLRPSAEFDIALQNETAALITSQLGSALAHGLMFDGAAGIEHPSFTPRGLEGKVLVMAEQAMLRPFVGLFVADMQRTGLGVRVTNVQDSTPAARAGVMKDDWLTHFNDEPITSKDNLKEHLAALHLGEEFTLKRENMKELTVTVGGAVRDGAEHSKALSDVVFLAWHSADTHDGAAPWNTGLVHNPAEAASAEQNHLPDRTLVFADLANSENIAEVDRAGVQLIPVSPDDQGYGWARAKFSENGHCGYVLRRPDVPPELHRSASKLVLSVVASPLLRGQSSPRIDSSVTVYGTPDRITGDDATGQMQLKLDIDDPESVLVLQQTVDGKVLTASLPAQLIRPGYRAVEFSDSTNDTKVPVLYHVERQDPEIASAHSHSVYDDQTTHSVDDVASGAAASDAAAHSDGLET